MAASLFSPSEWSKAVKAGIATLTTVGVVLTMYFAVDAWAEGKISASERRQIQSAAETQVRNEIDHDKIIQSTRISQSEINITITEMKLEELEDEIDERADAGRDPTARQERSMNRLTRLLETYESEQMDATSKLTVITHTTITTTTTTTENRP